MREFTETELKDLAAKIYYLDEQVYMVLGSNLGRVFNNGRVNSINWMVDEMQSGRGYVLRNELALISNMARTVQNEKAKSALMTQYNEIIQEVNELPTTQMMIDIMDKERNALNKTALQHRFDHEDHFIICFERAYGCGGTGIGFEVADMLHINYYDDEIFDEVLKRLEAEKDYIRDHGGYAYDRETLNNTPYVYTDLAFVPKKKPTLKQRISDFSRYHGLSKRDAIFFNQSGLLADLSKEEDFVIMGHCADIILTRHNIPHISILLTAPEELRVQRIMTVNDNMAEKQVRKLVKKQDKEYAKYFKFFTGMDWDDPSHYDFVINTSTYGVKGTAEMIIKMISRELIIDGPVVAEK